ncbi:MAG: hypothetical protein AAGF98_02585 [Cyanobacteria bacterium P01_H01_bin.153]
MLAYGQFAQRCPMPPKERVLLPHPNAAQVDNFLAKSTEQSILTNR